MKKRAAAPPPAFEPPDAASWVDALTEGVARLPIPWWSSSLPVALLLKGVQVVILRRAGILAAPGARFFILFFPVNFALAAFLLPGFLWLVQSGLHRRLG